MDAPAPAGGRVPPSDLDAESAVLSAILLESTALDQVSFLEGKHFYADANRYIYQAVLEVREQGRPVDIVTVAGYLRDRDYLQRAGGSPYLAQLSDATPAVANVADHAKTIVSKWELRQIISAAQAIVAEGFGDVGDPEEWKQSIDQRIFTVTRTVGREENITIIGDVTREAIQIVQDRQNSRGPVMLGPSTGLPTLDARIGGLEATRVYVIAARPGQGKTACATGMALACAHPHDLKDPDSIGDGVVFISVEMPRKQIAMRVLSQVARVDSNKLTRGKPNGEEWRRIMEAQQKIARMPIAIEDSSNHTPASIRAAMRQGRRKLEERFGKRVRVRVGAVDYLQLLSSTGGDNREGEISAISRAMKAIAKDEGLAMIALAQVNRECEKRKPPIPMLSDLRESGAIEQDADVVMFLYREDYYRPKGDTMDNKAQIIVAKARDFPTGVVRCEFNPSTTTFYEESKNPDYEQLGDMFDTFDPDQYKGSQLHEAPPDWMQELDDK